MSQSRPQTRAKKPLPTRSPSPDVSSKHLLLRTQPIQIQAPQKSNNKIPLLQEVLNLHNENRRLKELLANTKHGDIKVELEEKQEEIRQLRHQLQQNIKIKIDSSYRPSSQSLRASTDKKRKNSDYTQRREEEIYQLRAKVNDLLHDNQELRKSLLLRSVRSDDDKQINFSLIKKQALDAMTTKIREVEDIYNTKIKELNDRITRLSKFAQKQQNGYSSIRQSHRIMQVVTASKREGSAMKRDSQKYQTPKRDEDISHIQAQLTVSKNNIKELQRQNESLLQDNLSIKKAYQNLLKKTNYSFNSEIQDQSSQPSISFETQSQLNRLLLQNKSLKQTLQDLRNNTNTLQNQNQDLRSKLLAARLTASKTDSKEIKSAELQEKNILLMKQKELIKKELMNMSTTNETLLFEARSLEQENIRLKEQTQFLRNNIQELTLQQSNQLSKGNSKLEEIWNELNLSRKKIDTLELKNKQLEKELLMKGVQKSNNLDKDQEIFKLKDQLNKAVTEQKKIITLSNSQNDDLRRQLSSFRTRISEADKMLQQINLLDTNNKKQVAGLLRGLQEVKRMLDRISFQSLEINIREVGFKYKSVVEQKIQLLRRLKDKSNDGSRIEIENERLKRQTVQVHARYINEKSARESLESRILQQAEETKILKDQVAELNRVINEFIVKRIDVRISEESRVRELETDIIEDRTQRDIGQLRQLESQVRAVGSRLQDILKNAQIELQSSPNRRF